MIRRWINDRAAAIAAKRESEITAGFMGRINELTADVKQLIKDVLKLDKRIEKIEGRMDHEIDHYIRRLNAASRKYLKAEQARAMQLLPGEQTPPEDEAPIAGPFQPTFPELTGKAAVRARVAARRKEKSP